MSMAILLTAPPVLAHYLSWDSVDGRQIRYEDRTQWDGARTRATEDWNALGSVSIRGDAWNTITDLEIADYYSSTDGWCGYSAPRGGADLLSLNNYSFTRLNVDQRELCATRVRSYSGLGSFVEYSSHGFLPRLPVLVYVASEP